MEATHLHIIVGPLPLRISEKVFQSQILEAARYLGWLPYHVFDSRRSVPGFPDLVLVRPPRALFAELKTEKGVLSAAQTAWLAQLEGCPGIETFVWRPRDWETIVATLR
jgi:hypothetical protein